MKLTVDDFWYLKQAGAFSDYSKSELLDGDISGVPLQGEDEPESDASIPIKLRAQDYSLLDEAGKLDAHGKTELIDGVIYAMSPQHRPHWFIKNELNYRLRRALEAMGSSLYVGTEGSVLVSEHDVPEPDIIVTSDPIGKGPIPLDSVRLLVEISDSSRDMDFGIKVALYATSGIPEYWVVDVNEKVIHQMWAPEGEAYAERRDVAFGERIEAATVAGLAVATDRL